MSQGAQEVLKGWQKNWRNKSKTKAITKKIRSGKAPGREEPEWESPTRKKKPFNDQSGME